MDSVGDLLKGYQRENIRSQKENTHIRLASCLPRINGDFSHKHFSFCRTQTMKRLRIMATTASPSCGDCCYSISNPRPTQEPNTLNKKPTTPSPFRKYFKQLSTQSTSLHIRKRKIIEETIKNHLNYETITPIPLKCKKKILLFDSHSMFVYY